MSSVVTVHGLWMRGVSMAVLARRLAPRGFRVVAFEYPSVRGSLAANAAALADFIERVPGEVVHVVAHSLGGVVTRAMLERGPVRRLRRVVCLGSPLRGSVTAARLARLPGGSALVGRSLAEINARGGFDEWPAAADVGSIAGNWSFGFGLMLGPLPRPNDGTVAVAETNLPGLADHIVLPASHMALVWSSAVTAQVQHFLEHGRFRRAPAP